MIRCALTSVLALALAQTAIAQSALPPAFKKPVPDTLQDLREIETHVQKIVENVMPATVNLRIGPVQGSGVIINRDGYILTAGHVSGPANQDVLIILADGRRLQGRTLGANNGIDSGMVRITEKADFTHAEMGRSFAVTKGQWCLTLGHPGGFKPGRPPVVRLGRVQNLTFEAIQSDCALVGGDSGGPLFDMHGKVIGIHSRIGDKVSSNIHVPVDTYRDTWNRLAAGDIWGNPIGILQPFVKPAEVYFGVRAKSEKNLVKIDNVTPGSPADKAGLRIHDVILKIDDARLVSVDELSAMLKTRRPGTRIQVQVQRGAETMMIFVVLGKRTS